MSSCKLVLLTLAIAATCLSSALAADRLQPIGKVRPADGLVTSVTAASRVRVDFYEEALCPDCQAFIETDFKTTVEAAGVAAIMDLNIVPWGNAYYNISQCAGPEYDRTKYYCWVQYCAPGVSNPPRDCYNSAILCQHGPNECLGNNIEMCVVDKYSNNPLQLKDFIYCFEIENGGAESSVAQCAASANMDYTYIQSCYNNPTQLAGLQAFYANETASLGASKQGVPWVIINGVVLQNTADFLSTVCSQYSGVKPQGCK